MPTPQTLDRWIWVLVYGGIILLGLGLAMSPASPGTRWTLTLGGAAAAFVGILLIWIRSRLRDRSEEAGR